MGSNDPAPLGYETSQVPGGGENPENWSIDQINDAFKPLKADLAFAASEQYTQIVNLWQQGVDTFQRSITRSISDTWEGASADAAKASIQNYCTKAQELIGPLQTLATAIHDCSTAIGKTSNAVPAPVAVTWTSWINPWHRFDLEDQQGEHKARAREAFTNYYVQPLGKVDSTIPVLPTAVDAAHPLDIGKYQGPGTPGSNGPGITNSGYDTTPSATTNPDQNKDKSNSDQSTDHSTTPSNTGNSDTGTKPTSTGTDPTTTHSTGFDPSATTPSSFTGGGAGGGGLGSAGGLGTSSGGGPGHSVPGAGTTNATQNAAAAAARTGTGTSGMAGMGGMGAPGKGKGDGEGDGEHKTPGYLVNAENLEEWIGDIPKTVPGGVIGGDFQQYEDKPRP